MRRAIQQNLSNALWGVLDYAAWPIGILVLAPVLLRHLGIARFGIWAAATAAINTGAILASGFGDANIQLVATRRCQGTLAALIQTVRTAMGIHITLGAAIGGIAWILAPAFAARMVSSDAALRADCLWSLRVASFIIVARAVETVCVSTQRAFERYGSAVYVSVAGRTATIVSAAVLAFFNRSIADILVANAAVMILSVALQLGRLRALLNADSLFPALDRNCLRALLAFGFFSWIQALSSVVVGQADRLFTGAVMGAAAVAAYALCVQITQPLYGIASSGLHFLFPHFAARAANTQPLRRPIARALAANAGLVAAGALFLICAGPSLLRLLAGPRLAATGVPLLPLILCGTVLLALSVSPYYVLLALGRVRTVAAIHLAASGAMLLCISILAPIRGVGGIVLARLLYGFITLSMYFSLLRYFLPDARNKMPGFSRKTEFAHARTLADPTGRTGA